MNDHTPDRHQDAATTVMELYHSGYIVADIEASMKEFSASLGLTWAAVTPRPLRVSVDDGPPQMIDLLATYSQQGPPYIELIQEINGTVWSNCGLNHLGYWVADLEAAVQALQRQGSTHSVRALDEHDCPIRFAYLKGDPAGGPWIELVDAAVRPQLMEWIGGGNYQV